MIPAGNYMFKVNNRNTSTRCGTSSKLTIKTPERRHGRRPDAFIVNFEHISLLVLVFLLLTLDRQMPAGMKSQIPQILKYYIPWYIQINLLNCQKSITLWVEDIFQAILSSSNSKSYNSRSSQFSISKLYAAKETWQPRRLVSQHFNSMF